MTRTDEASRAVFHSGQAPVPTVDPAGVQYPTRRTGRRDLDGHQ